MRPIQWSTAALALAVAGSAQAGFTAFGSSSEPSVYSIFSSNYGAPSVTQATFEGTGTQATFAFGSYSFTRVHDNGFSTPTDLHTAYTSLATPTTDERFHDGTTSVRFVVKYAGFTNRIGYSNSTGAVNSGNYADIIGSSGSVITTLSPNFQLATNVNNAGSTYWGSDTGTNTDSGDHFLTWFVQGGGRNFWVVAVEDLVITGSDKDYNDWVGEFEIIPLPPAAWAGISSLIGVAGLGYIRRRRMMAS